MITWVIGRGGLLGSAVARHSGNTYDPGPVPWDSPDQARRVLLEQARSFESVAGAGTWTVVWAAGSATTSTPRAEALTELEPLNGVLDGLRGARPGGPGSFFLTSSAGGVYAGSSNPPFDATTPPVPLSPYGELKLAQEEAVGTLAGICPVVIGRISNLYGPGQNLDKLQGLISRLALAAATRQPVNIFVSLDTIRDYIYADDAGRAIAALAHGAAMTEPAGARIEVIASGNPATVGQLIRTMNQVTKRRIPVGLGTHPSATAQAPDLRVAPTTPLPEVTPLPAGMKAVFLDIIDRLQQQELVS